MSGKILIFEGLDKTGKTTQIKILSKYLNKNGIKNIITREPGGTEIGNLIREILLHKGKEINYLTEYFLFIADRFEHIISKVLDFYNDEYWVLIDRFHFSSFSYQIYPYMDNDIDLIEIDKIVGKKLFSMINFEKIFYFTKKEYESIVIKGNKSARLNHSKLSIKDKIEKRSDEYFYKVLKGYELSFSYYKDFSNFVEKIYFEDGVSNNSRKIRRVIDKLIN